MLPKLVTYAGWFNKIKYYGILTPPKRENFGRLKLFLLLEADFETQGAVKGFLNAKLVMVAIFTSGKNWYPMGCLVN